MTASHPRIYLSPPDSGEDEIEAVSTAMRSNWLAPLGPDVDAFEHELAAASGRAHAAATNSGTAALQLALRLVGVVEGSRVVIPSLTFVATANAAAYLGARPVFVDVDERSWTLDPHLLEEELTDSARRGEPVAAVIAVDLYGQCADYDALGSVCRRHGVPLVLDSAEALGATFRGRPAGSAGELAVFSFNGNKIITTSGGGMLVGDDADAIAEARVLASQARSPALHYEHDRLGYNYRLSNILAALGRVQLRSLPDKVARRVAINSVYRQQLGHVPGVGFQPVADYGDPTFWLTVLVLGDDAATSPRALIAALESENIEARPGWKPLHLQPLYAHERRRGGRVSEDVFARTVCLPSGSSLTEQEQARIVERVRSCLGGG